MSRAHCSGGVRSSFSARSCSPSFSAPIAAQRRPARSIFVRMPVEPDGRGPRWFPVAAERPPRVRSLRSFVGHAYAPAPSLEALRESLGHCSGSVEWMVHPGRRPGSPFTDSDARDREEELLCDRELPGVIAALGYRLASFRQLLAQDTP